MSTIRPLRLPDLPDGWTWHVAIPYGKFRIALIDGTRVGRIAFRKENPAESTTTYQRLLEVGSQVAAIEEPKPRKALKRASALADKAWLIADARATLEKRTDTGGSAASQKEKP